MFNGEGILTKSNGEIQKGIFKDGVFEKKLDKLKREEEEEENNANPEEIRNFEIISKIISQNPEKWKLEDNMDKINLKEYQNIRKKLIIQAHKAYASRKYQDAQVIMAKARRYKQEINKIMEKKKINLFMKNNKEHAIGNLYNKNEHVIDLHGLSLEESKMIIKKKFSTLSKQKESEDIDKIMEKNRN